jgi:hypothetical protein
MDPSDDCTFWYVGDYYKEGAANYSTRIGAFRLPDCAAETNACTGKNRGGNGVRYWAGSRGKTVLARHDPEWRKVVHHDVASIDAFQKWLRDSGESDPAAQLAAAALNVTFGTEDGNVTVEDPVVGDRPAVRTLINRAAALPDAAKYAPLLRRLNDNTAAVCSAAK